MSADVRWLADRAAIHDLIARYAWAIDTWDAEAAAACFTADGRLCNGAGDVLADGRDALVAFFSRGRTGGRFGTMGDGELVAVSHTIGSVLVEPGGENRASARSACTATSLARHPAGEALYLHGIRYEDLLRRTEAGWLVACRVHHLDWAKVVSQP